MYYSTLKPINNTFLKYGTDCLKKKKVSFLSKGIPYFEGFPGDSDGKEYAYNAGDPASIPSSGRPLEKGLATHSNILAWRIPWTEEPGCL